MHYEIAGEPGGAVLAAVVHGVPVGLRIREEDIYADVARWARMADCLRETPAVAICSGVADGRTTGAPVLLTLDNRIYADSRGKLDRSRSVACPGSAELAASARYDEENLIAIADRCDPRIDAMKVAAASLAREVLAAFGVEVFSCVTRIGAAGMQASPFDGAMPPSPIEIENSPFRCPSAQVTRAMEVEVARAGVQGDTLGGELAVAAYGMTAGVGGLRSGGRSLEARLSAALFAVEGVTGVEFGAPGRTRQPGSVVYDAPAVGPCGLSRTTNKAAGIEEGFSTGLPLVVRAGVLPSARLGQNAPSIDSSTLEPAAYRAAVFSCCDVPAKSVTAESEVALALADAYLEAFGADTMTDTNAAFASYARRLKNAAR